MASGLFATRLAVGLSPLRSARRRATSLSIRAKRSMRALSSADGSVLDPGRGLVVYCTFGPGAVVALPAAFLDRASDRALSSSVIALSRPSLAEDLAASLRQYSCACRSNSACARDAGVGVDWALNESRPGKKPTQMRQQIKNRRR